MQSYLGSGSECICVLITKLNAGARERENILSRNPQELECNYYKYQLQWSHALINLSIYIYIMKENKK